MARGQAYFCIVHELYMSYLFLCQLSYLSASLRQSENRVWLCFHTSHHILKFESELTFLSGKLSNLFEMEGKNTMYTTVEEGKQLCSCRVKLYDPVPESLRHRKEVCLQNDLYIASC